MDTIVITQGSKEGAYLGEDGTFPATLVSVDDKGKGGRKADGFPPFPAREPGQKDYYIREWAFSIEGADDDASMVWASSSENTSPRSKGYGYIVALCGGKQPPVGTEFSIKTQLYGRMALVTVYRKPDGFMEVDKVTAMPKGMQATPKTVTPAKPPEPVATPVLAVEDDGLPF